MGTALGIQGGGTSQATAPGARIALGLEIGADIQAHDNDLDAIAAISTTGILVRTATDTWATRTITGTANEITVTNGSGTAGNPTISIPTAVTFTGKTITGGTYVSGAFNGTLGATTPSSGVFTTISSSSTATFGGTTAINAQALAHTFIDAGATGPVYTSTHDSSSPAANDALWVHNANGKNLAGTAFTYGTILWRLTDATTGNEDSSYELYNRVAGTLTLQLNATATGLQIPAIGATTRGTGAFTTLAANNTVTFTNGGSMTGTWSDLGSVTTVDINGGTIDGTTVGASSATTGRFTTVTTTGTGTAITSTGVVDISAANAGQIVFPATQNASANANTLDDYEEGTTTPTPTPATGAFTTASASVSYTKIGNRCFINGSVTITTNGTGATAVDVPLPFTASTERNAGVGWDVGTGVILTGVIVNDATNIRLFTAAAGYPGGSGKILAFSAQYKVA